MEKDQLSRKLAVILHADVVGSTSLVQKNETLAHERIQAAFHQFSKTINSYGGMTRELRGDALVAEFDRASDAVAAALAFQVSNGELNATLVDDIQPQLRMGISLGEVVIADNTITGAGVVLAQRLEQLADSGGVVVQGSVSETVPARMPFEFESLGEMTLKGFDHPVKAFAARLRSGEELPEPEKDVTLKTLEPTGLQLPEKPSIAVLPFTNMSGDPEQEYFSDGITEDIITELSRFQMLVVIARHSSFAFKNQAIDIKEIGKKLGVRYVVEGSVRKLANRIRISVQLVDAITGAHIWVERYDRAIEDIFDVQDEVTHAVVSALPGQIQRAVLERTERKRTESMTAYDCLLRGNWNYQLFTHEGLFEAIRLYQKAIELDPGFAQAYARLADTYNSVATQGWETNVTLHETMEIARRAIALDGNDNWARLALAWALLRDQQFDNAEEQFEIALSINRNDADCICWVASGFVCLGRAEEGYELILQAMRLNPLHLATYHSVLGNALYFTGRFKESVRVFKQCEAVGALNYANLAAAYGQVGQIEEARLEARKFIKVRRKQLETDSKSFPNSDMELVAPKIERFRRQADRDRFLDGLRKAGLSG
ncbi:MAG: tetratricopeptide repeat protein [Gammaproteobacteria bacterium]|nr:tetratricopeptide repeat protein [Gammaproteobacteria bacterium]